MNYWEKKKKNPIGEDKEKVSWNSKFSQDHRIENEGETKTLLQKSRITELKISSIAGLCMVTSSGVRHRKWK